MLRMMLLPIIGYSAVWVATEEAREMAADVEAARIAAKLTRSQIASLMGLGEPPHGEKRYSDQITLKQPLNLYRLADLPLAFWMAFVKLRAQRAGLQVIEDSRISELMKKLDRIQVKLLKAELKDRDDERMAV